MGRGGLIALLMCVLGACANAPTASAPQPVPDRLFVLPVIADVAMMKLSGERETRADWQDMAQQQAADAISADLNERAIGADFAIGPGPQQAARLAHIVLPAAFAHASLDGQDARQPLATARDLADWSLGPLSIASETGPELALVIAPRADFTSGGHQAAQVGIGVAFGTLVSPDGGPRQLYGALIETGTGNLVAIGRVSGGDVRESESAQRLIANLLDELIAEAP